MREPYRTLLGQYQDHCLMARFLDGDEPRFAELANSDVWHQISSSELLMWHVALAFYNGDTTARMADIHRLDYENRVRVADAILIVAGMVR